MVGGKVEMGLSGERNRVGEICRMEVESPTPVRGRGEGRKGDREVRMGEENGEGLAEGA
jgi:hypothetical protein